MIQPASRVVYTGPDYLPWVHHRARATRLWVHHRARATLLHSTTLLLLATLPIVLPCLGPGYPALVYYPVLPGSGLPCPGVLPALLPGPGLPCLYYPALLPWCTRVQDYPALLLWCTRAQATLPRVYSCSWASSGFQTSRRLPRDARSTTTWLDTARWATLPYVLLLLQASRASQ